MTCSIYFLRRAFSVSSPFQSTSISLYVWVCFHLSSPPATWSWICSPYSSRWTYSRWARILSLSSSSLNRSFCSLLSWLITVLKFSLSSSLNFQTLNLSIFVISKSKSVFSGETTCFFTIVVVVLTIVWVWGIGYGI